MSASGNTQSQGAGPKVLRIGIVQRGKIIDEREMKKRESVSIGNGKDPKATFQVASDALPGSFTLFDYDGKKYFLRFSEGIEARIQIDGPNVVDFGALESQGKVSDRQGAKAVELTDESRGKVMIGDITVLFQFKAPLAIPAKPVLPVEIRGSLVENVDIQFAAIFVLVAIFQISLVTYARSLPYVEPSSIEQVSERYQKLIMPDRAPEPPKIEEAIAEEKGEEPKKEEPKKGDDSSAKGPKKKGEGKPVDAEAAAKARKEAIAKEVAGKGLLRVLGANRTGAGALSDVFEEGGGAMGNLGDAFSGIQGVDFATAGGQAGTRGGGSGQGVGIGDLATEGGGSVESGVKTETEVQGSATVEAPEVDGDLSQEAIASVMKRQLKALRACYEGALKRDKGLAGKVVIRFEILESGKISNIEFEDVSLGSGDVQECIRRRAQFWRFPKPEGGSVFVAYPIVFTPAA